MNDIISNLSPMQLAKFAAEGIDVNKIVTTDQPPRDMPVVNNLPAPFRFSPGKGKRGKDVHVIRNAIMQTYEQQYPDFILHGDVWDFAGMYVIHNGVMYYSKQSMQARLDEESRDQVDDVSLHPLKLSILQGVAAEFGADIVGPLTFGDVENVIAAAPTGMPVYIGENDEFYEFEGTPGQVVTPKIMTRELLNLIRDTLFVGNLGLYYAPADDAIVIRGEQVYMVNLLMWYQRPTIPALGVYFHGGLEQHCYFFPFEPLSPAQYDTVMRYCATEHSESKPLKIVDLV